MALRLLATLLISVLLGASAQDTVRPKGVREVGKQGATAIPQLAGYLKNSDHDVRLEAVKQIAAIGSARSIDPLIEATRSNDPEIQIRATDGLVNFYLPGYTKTGIGGSLSKMGTGIKGKFSDTNDQIIDAYVMVRPEVITAVGVLARSGSNMESRAGAARAAGILRGKGAVPDLIEAARSRNSQVIYEALVALQKIRDESAGPQVSFLLRDLDPKVQEAAIETAGILRNMKAVPDLVEVLNRSREAKIKRAALESIAMLPDPSSRAVYMQYLNDKDEKMRAAAAEGLGRLRSPTDLPAVQKAWEDEGKTSPRLSDAFALVLLGKTDLSEFSPLQYVINNLNSSAYGGIAQPFLIELARDARVRNELYAPMGSGTKDEKIGIARVLAISGDRDSVEPLKKLSNDPDPEVAQAGLTAVKNLQSRM